MMLKRNKIIIGFGTFSLFLLLLSGCSKKLYEQKQSHTGQNSSATHTTDRETGEIHTEKDTTRTIDAPVESSRNQVTDSSYLATSLAWSSAVCRDGRLDHRIGNRSQITVPVREKYVDRWHTLHDTVIFRDTLWREEAVTVTKETTPLSLRIWAGIGKGLLILLVAVILWYKFIKKWK